MAVIIESKDRTLSDSAFCPIVQGYPDLIDNKRLLLLTGVGFLYSTSVDGEHLNSGSNGKTFAAFSAQSSKGLFVKNKLLSLTPGIVHREGGTRSGTEGLESQLAATSSHGLNLIDQSGSDKSCLAVYRMLNPRLTSVYVLEGVKLNEHLTSSRGPCGPLP